jgi:hypothetical protein
MLLIVFLLFLSFFVDDDINADFCLLEESSSSSGSSGSTPRRTHQHHHAPADISLNAVYDGFADETESQEHDDLRSVIQKEAEKWVNRNIKQVRGSVIRIDRKLYRQHYRIYLLS